MPAQTQIATRLAPDALLEKATGATTSRIRILHVISYMGRGGAEMGIMKLMARLGDTQFEQRICTTRGFDPEFVRTRLPEEMLYSAGNPELRLQFPLFRLARIMREFRPHIVHSRNWGALEAVVAAKLAGVPVVIHSEHGYEVDMFAGLPLRRRLFRHAAYAMANGIFALSRELRAFHAQQAWIPPQRMSVIYNGVDTEHFTPCTASRVSMRQDLGLPQDSFVLGSVGRLVPIKDQQTLFKAATVLAEGGFNVRVLLVGSGPERKNLERLVSGALSGRVCFAGDSERIPELLNAMDVFVLPSLGEGMSNTLLEAMACGLPVLATSVGGNPEIIENDQHGWLFAPGDVPSLSKKLQILASDPALIHQLGTAARKRAIEFFSLDRMLENYRSFYLNLAAPRIRMDTAHVRN